MNLAERRWLRLFTLCALYVAQGMPWGFMAATLPAYLAERGLDVASVSMLISLTYLPFAFKWAMGPLIDAVTWRRFGRRRPWIVFAQAMMASTVFVLVAFDLSREVELLLTMVFVHTVFNALQDVAVDALAVDLLDEDERGRANGLMYGSKYIGGAMGGVGMAKLIAWQSLEVALIVQTSILVAIMFLPLFMHERERDEVAGVRAREIVVGLRQAFSLRSTLVAALLMLAMNFGIGMIMPTANALFVGPLGWKQDEYVELTGGWGLVVGGLVAASAGWLVDRLGRRRVAAIASFGVALGWIAWAQGREYWHDTTFVYVTAFFQQACQAALSVALIALCMDLSWSKVGASQFAAYMALSNFSTTLGSQFAARANELWEFHGVYLAAGAIQICVTVLLVPIDPTETRRRLPFPSGTRLPWFAVSALMGLLAFLIAMTVWKTQQYLG